MADTSESRSPPPDDWFPQYDHLATRPSIEDPTHPLYNSQQDEDDQSMLFSPIGPRQAAEYVSQSGPSSEVQSTSNPFPAEETSASQEDGIEDEEDAESGDDRYNGDREDSAVQANILAFKNLHVPGEPVFIVHVHDLLTASIAAHQPECQVLCIDLPTLYQLLGWRYANSIEFLAKDCYQLITTVSRIAQRNGKLLTVDMGTQEGALLQQYVPHLLGLGVVGVDLRDSH
ncbi:hypothetical protein BR93DRAFT_970041 [Coniochaeta sp. PMI_546]|nr:hypothetical protein BR93DRAFT_970041 [Coniochaeta sp. PMI_546]